MSKQINLNKIISKVVESEKEIASISEKIDGISFPDTENLITKDEVAETYATKEELSALTPLVYGSFGFPNTTSGNYNLLVAILGDKFNPKHYGKLHSISLQCGDSLPANSNGHSTAGPAYMYIGKWSEVTNTITDIIEVSTNYVEMTSNSIVTFEFDSDADYSDTDKICFCLHSTNNKTVANINQGQMLIRAKVGPYTDEDSYVWSSATNNQKGNYLPAFMARCEAFGGGQIQVVDYVEEHNHGVVTSNAVYKEITKIEDRISDLEQNGGSTDIDTSSLTTKTEFNNHVGDYDTHFATGEKSELYQDIDDLQETVRTLQSELQAIKLENISLKTWVEENFIKGKVVAEGEVPEDDDKADDYNYIIKPTE